MNKRVMFSISLSVAIVCVLIIMSYVAEERFRVLGEYEMVPVLRATQDISRLTILEDHMAELVNIPKKYAPPGALSDKLDLRGKIADSPIKKGEVICGNKIILPSRRTGLSQHIAQGKRAITIAVSDITGVAGLIKPYDHVDIMLITSHGDNDNQDKKINLLYQDILVLATGDYLGTGVPSSTEKDDVTNALKFVDPNTKRYLNITLSASPKQVMGLVLAQEFGQLYFSLRPAFNSKNTNVPSMNIEDVTGFKTPVKQSIRPAWMSLRNSSVNF